MKMLPCFMLPCFSCVLRHLRLFFLPFLFLLSACTESGPVESVESVKPEGVVDIEEVVSPAAEPESGNRGWEQAGWGGGGYFYAAAFHPTRDGVIYLAGDVGGVYKTEDQGRNWRMINKGLANYAVFSLAVDPQHPETVFAATQGGLCKSVDGGELWQLLPETGPKALGIFGKKKMSIRSVAVDPSDGNIVYAASPLGKVFKSLDGGQSWDEVYKAASGGAEEAGLRLQFGKANGDYYAGMWSSFAFPENVKAADAVGIGFNFKGDGAAAPKSFALFIKGKGFSYKSRNLNELFADTQVRDVVLKADDFSVDPEFLKKNPEVAASLPASPDWSKITRIDLSCVGDLPRKQHVARLTSFFIAGSQTTDGKVGEADRPVLVPVQVFKANSKPGKYGNLRFGDPVSGSIYSVAVSEKDPARVIASTNDRGLVLSTDHGKTWTALSTPARASNAAFDPKDANVIYGTFFSEGIWKSTDAGKSWAKLSEGMSDKVSLLEVAVSPENPQEVYAVGATGWSGSIYRSKDGGQSWILSSETKADYAANPTLPKSGKNVKLSTITNVSINPSNPQQLFVSANWRCSWSEDGGATWEERIKGADISCVTDIQFVGNKTYVSVMDEGTLVSADHGESWKQLWPLKHETKLSGHNWRVRVTPIDGVDRIISTASPWDGKIPQLIVVSEDGGETYSTTNLGLPDYRISANTMWGRGYPRALAVDPSDPQTVYLGIDGDATPGKMGGGVFKSLDGGHSWSQLSNQPGSRRMYYGLAIDPTAPQRIYWAGFGNKGGVYRSENGGGNWDLVFSKDAYLFNLHTTADGTVYAGGKQLYRSRDQGESWQTLTKIEGNKSIVGIEVHPEDPKTIWISVNVWSHDASGAIYKSTDGGETWEDITGDIPFNHPQILRFNPVTHELWAGYVGLYKIKQ